MESSKKLLFIVNPVSGKKLVLKHLAEIIRCFMDAGFTVTTMVTSRRGEATEIVRRHAAEHHRICCAGGDGTLNETLTGLAITGLNIPLSYIPCGSTNDFAIAHGLSSDIMKAAEKAAFGSSRRYDVGRFGDRYFSYVAAFGAFSWLSYTTDQNLKNVLGHTAYIIDGIKDLPKVKPHHVKITADGAVHEADYIFGAICNTTSIAGTVELPHNQVDTCDGRLELLLIKNPRTILEFEAVVKGLHNQDYSCPLIEFFRASDIWVENPPGLEWALDGEGPGLGEKVHIEILPGFLELVG